MYNGMMYRPNSSFLPGQTTLSIIWVWVISFFPVYFSVLFSFINTYLIICRMGIILEFSLLVLLIILIIILLISRMKVISNQVICFPLHNIPITFFFLIQVVDIKTNSSSSSSSCLAFYHISCMLTQRNYVTDVLLGNIAGLILSFLAVLITGHPQVKLIFHPLLSIFVFISSQHYFI